MEIQLRARPALAPQARGRGGTTHEFDPATGKVVRHVERWDVQPGKVVSQLLVPSSKIPENRWEVFMFSLSDGDFFGMWLAASPAVIKLTGPWVAISLVFKALGVSAEGTRSAPSTPSRFGSSSSPGSPSR